MDVAKAIDANPMSIILCVLMISAVVISFCELLRGEQVTLHRLAYSVRPAYCLAGLVMLFHVARCSVWLLNGTLMNEYLTSSWTYRLLSWVDVL